MSYYRERYAVSYAKALAKVTSSEKGNELIGQLTNLNQIMIDNSQLITAFASHRLPPEVENNLIETLCGDALLTKKILSILVKNGHIKILGRIIDKFKDLQNKRQGLMNFKVTVTYALDSDQQNKLKAILKSRFNLNDVHIDYQIDKNLIGGIIVKSDSYLIDDSIRTRLNRVRDSLFHININTKELEA